MTTLKEIDSLLKQFTSTGTDEEAKQRMDDLRTMIIRRVMYSYNTDFPQKGKFLGLYRVGPDYEHRIVWRADQQIETFRYLSDHGARVPYYVQDPVAWAPLPDIYYEG